MAEIKKIPVINDYFDADIFVRVVKKSLWFVVLLFFISVVSAFLFFRYTPPSYNARSILQINEQDQTSMLLKIEAADKNSGLLKSIELLRSKEFLKRTFSQLPLIVEYYVEGTFLSHELYRASPFIIEYKSDGASLYGRKFYLDFDDDSKGEFRILSGDSEVAFKADENKWVKVPGGYLKYEVTNLGAIHSQKKNFKGYRYFFVVNNPEGVVEKYIGNLSVSLLNRSAQTVEISYTCNNALKAADIVNAVAENFIDYEVEVKKESAESILRFIEMQLKVVYNKLDETERSLQTFRRQNRISDNKVNGLRGLPIFTTKISEFEDQILEIEFELMTLKRVQNQIDDAANINMYELIASLAGTNSEQVVSSALANLQKLIVERNILLNDVTKDNFKVQILDNQIEKQQELISEFINNAVTRLSEKKTDYENKLREYENKVFNDKGYDEIEYTRLERLYSINESFYTQLIEKKAEYLISQAGYVSQSTILEKAQTSKYQVAPIKKQIYPVFLITGLLLGSMVIIIRYLFFSKITSVSSIQNLTTASVIGTIPTYKHEIPVSQLLVDKNLNSMFTESFRTVRTNMQFISHGAETKIITVTSTIAAEGKTFVSINLAGIIALSKKRVIVLDLDLRKPRIHLGFNVPNDKGVSTILIGKHTYKECLRTTDIDGFDYITAGPIPPNPAELANSISMENLIHELENFYDVIIIDTPPVGIVADAVANLQRANYPIYVMKANVSNRRFIENINYLVNTKNLENLSVLLNGVEHRKRSYGYGSNYGYGYGYGYYQEEKEESVSIMERIFKRKKK